MVAIQGDRYPQPPAGYQPAVLFQYPKIKLQIAALAVLAVITPLSFFLVWVLQPQSNEGSTISVNDVAGLVTVILTVLVTTTVHELAHGAAYQLFGYRVTYGVSKRLLAAYAAAFDQWQTRDHNVIVALTPLVVLTMMVLPVLTIQSHVAILIGVTALMMNTAGAVGDVYLAWRLLRMPRATLLYDKDVKTMLVFLPE